MDGTYCRGWSACLLGSGPLCAALSVFAIGCGDDQETTAASTMTASASATMTASATVTVTASSTGTDTQGSGGSGSASEASISGTSSTTALTTTAGESSSTDATASTGDTSTTGDPSTSSSTEADTSSSTGAPACDLDQVPDTLGFTYVSKFDTGLPDAILQATYYNTDDDEVMVMSYNGKARRFATDGTPLSEVFDVPPEAQPKLDGATYDPILDRGLLITQDCRLVEVEPQTLETLEYQDLGFGMAVCAGLALGLDNNLYIASHGTDEMVVLSRDGSQEIRRVNMLGDIMLDGFDGITLIAGSENFLVMSTSPSTAAAIIDGFGNIVVPTAPIGQAQPPLKDGMPDLPDAVLTICSNGHAWLCEAYNSTCFDYAPNDGDKNACPCLIPQ